MCYPIIMATKTKIPVFFVATKAKKEPVVVNFYTKRGKPVAFHTVKRVKTKNGVQFYTETPTP